MRKRKTVMLKFKSKELRNSVMTHLKIKAMNFEIKFQISNKNYKYKEPINAMLIFKYNIISLENLI